MGSSDFNVGGISSYMTYYVVLSPLFHVCCHLSCLPKQGDRKKGTRRKSFTACSVVLGTFRKLADRNIFVHPSLALRERVRVRVGFVPRLRRPALARCTRKRSGADSPKCLTLGLGRMPRFSHGKLLVKRL